MRLKVHDKGGRLKGNAYKLKGYSMHRSDHNLNIRTLKILQHNHGHKIPSRLSSVKPSPLSEQENILQKDIKV